MRWLRFFVFCMFFGFGSNMYSSETVSADVYRKPRVEIRVTKRVNAEKVVDKTLEILFNDREEEEEFIKKSSVLSKAPWQFGDLLYLPFSISNKIKNCCGFDVHPKHMKKAVRYLTESKKFGNDNDCASIIASIFAIADYWNVKDVQHDKQLCKLALTSGYLDAYCKQWSMRATEPAPQNSLSSWYTKPFSFLQKKQHTKPQKDDTQERQHVIDILTHVDEQYPEDYFSEEVLTWFYEQRYKSIEWRRFSQLKRVVGIIHNDTIAMVNSIEQFRKSEQAKLYDLLYPVSVGSLFCRINGIDPIAPLDIIWNHSGGLGNATMHTKAFVRFLRNFKSAFDSSERISLHDMYFQILYDVWCCMSVTINSKFFNLANTDNFCIYLH
jgi:hypothetical protein